MSVLSIVELKTLEMFANIKHWRCLHILCATLVYIAEYLGSKHI